MINQVRLEGPGRIALQAILEDQARLGNTFAADVFELLRSLNQPGNALSSDILVGDTVPQERSRDPDCVPVDTGPTNNLQSIFGNLSSATLSIPADISSANAAEQLAATLGLAVQPPHPRTQVFTTRHSDSQAISSTSSNTSTVNQLNNDPHANRREPSPYPDTTLSTQYPGINGGAVGAPENLSTYNRSGYTSFPDVSAQLQYLGDPYLPGCPRHDLNTMANTPEQPELTSAYDRGLVPPPSDSFNTPNVGELAAAYESGFMSPPSNYLDFPSVFDLGFGPPPRNDNFIQPVYDCGLGPPPSEPFDTANVPMQLGFA